PPCRRRRRRRIVAVAERDLRPLMPRAAGPSRPDIASFLAPKSIAVVGASIGGNLAVVASAQFDVQAAVSISPKTSAVRNLAGRDSLSLSSVYYISSSLDQGGKRKAWVEELYGLTTAPKELDIVQGTGHGVYIFAEDPQLPDRIVAWLDTQLKKAASQP
ncbi:MAG: hypothetical protein HOE86_02460, partial [Gemmatimonadetes bacterium]|nr:hypothetical protein [Gemmatimonadota bacterium]